MKTKPKTDWKVWLGKHVVMECIFYKDIMGIKTWYFLANVTVGWSGKHNYIKTEELYWIVYNKISSLQTCTFQRTSRFLSISLSWRDGDNLPLDLYIQSYSLMTYLSFPSTDKERNFDKVNTINYNISYDYNSVMQYRK